MTKNAMFERDLLYPTENIYEPGSFHIEVLNPDKGGMLPVVIEGKTNNSLIKNINTVTRVMQSEIFDRILLNIKSNVKLYIKANDEQKKEFGGKEYVFVSFEGDMPSFSGIDSVG